jgi:AraC-like DNA-binding protein
MPRQPVTQHAPRPEALSHGPRATFLSLISVEATTTSGWERHRHADYELILVERGTYRATVQGVAVSVTPGNGVLIVPGDWHEDLLTAGVRYQALWFRLAHGEILVPGSAVEARLGTFGSLGKGHLHADVARLRAVIDSGGPASHLDAIVATLLWSVAAGLPPAGLAMPFAPQAVGFADAFRRACAQVGGGGLRVATLARSLGLSPRSLERRCRAELGRSPARAYARWRLERAAELLLTTDWPVRAISDTLGYANPFHFSRAFARCHGKPPSRWREHVANG